MNCKFMLARVKFTWHRYEMQIMNRLLSDVVDLILSLIWSPSVFLRMMRNFIKGANKKKDPMHAFYASGRRYNHSQTVFFRLLWRFQPVFWTSACCSFNWVTADTKAHKSNFITLSFGTSTQRGNIYRQLSEKWSSAIWHKQSSSLCHDSKAAPACRSVRVRFVLSLYFPFKTKSKTHRFRANSLFRFYFFYFLPWKTWKWRY